MRKDLLIFRVAHGLSQERFAELIGFHRMTYADVENGKREPSLKFVTAISTAFEMPLSEVVEMMKVYEKNS